MAVIDILTVIDPLGFDNNSVPLSTPINQIPNISNYLLTNNVKMIAETGSVSYGQATSNIGINAKRGDTIRWWDTSVIQDTNEDLIIVGFQKYSNWDTVMNEPQSKTKGIGMAYIQSGFSLDTLANLQFAMNSFQNNYIEAIVRNDAPIGTTIYYYLIVAKLNVSQVGGPTLDGLYRFDPSITVIQ